MNKSLLPIYGVALSIAAPLHAQRADWLLPSDWKVFLARTLIFTRVATTP